MGLSASSTIHTPSRLEGQMEDPEEWNVPSLSLFMSLDDYPSHRPPGGRGGPVGPREQVGTTMPLLGPYHLGPEARGRGDPRLTAQRGRGSGSTGTGRPRGEPGARSTHAPALIHPGACRHTPHTRRAQCHRTHGRKGKQNLEGCGCRKVHGDNHQGPRAQASVCGQHPFSVGLLGPRGVIGPSCAPVHAALRPALVLLALLLLPPCLLVPQGDVPAGSRGASPQASPRGSLDPAPQRSSGPAAAGRTPGAAALTAGRSARQSK